MLLILGAWASHCSFSFLSLEPAKLNSGSLGWNHAEGLSVGLGGLYRCPGQVVILRSREWIIIHGPPGLLRGAKATDLVLCAKRILDTCVAGKEPTITGLVGFSLGGGEAGLSEGSLEYCLQLLSS